MLFAKPDQVNGVALEGEIVALGYAEAHVTVLRGGLHVATVPDVEDDEAAVAAIGAVVAAHTGAPTADQAEAAEDRATFQVTAAQAAKARQVWNGTAVFTDPQAQKILAGVVLDWWRRQGGTGG